MSMLRVKHVIMSHLSDAEIEMTFNTTKVHRRLEFVKYLLLKYPDTSTYLPIEKFDELWKELNKN